MTGAGVLFYSINTNRFLFLLRNYTRTKGTWGIPGGKIENENIMVGLKRELLEELGDYPAIIKAIPLEVFTSFDGNFSYHSFIFLIQDEFIPNLNDEHEGYAWSTLDHFPHPMHPTLFQTINIDVIRDKINIILDSCKNVVY